MEKKGDERKGRKRKEKESESKRVEEVGKERREKNIFLR